MNTKTKQNKQKWPYNSELYSTLREIRSEMPKLNLTFDFNIANLGKPNGRKRHEKQELGQ